MKKSCSILLALVMGVLLSGCGPLPRLARPTQVPTPAFGTYTPPVQSIQVEVRESDPPQVSALLRVMFSATCDKEGQTPVKYADRIFHITVVAVTPIDHGCAPAIEPAQVRVPLETRGLAPGYYTVEAGVLSALFTLK